MKYLIIGFGITGVEVEKYLKKNNDEYMIYDQKKIAHEKYLSYEDLYRDLPLFDFGIKSPGIKKDSKEYRLISILCKDIISEIDFAYSKISSTHLIGVTGSNGKTSFCNFLATFLKNKYRTFLAGNIGISLISLIDKIKEDDYVIIELSSFQIEDSKYLKLQDLFITSICENHLNYYGDKTFYLAAKKRGLLLCANEPYILNTNELFIKNCQYNDEFIDKIKYQLTGKYNIEYALYAYTYALKHHIDKEKLSKSISDLQMVKYRLNVSKKVDFLTFINDSKSTSADASEFAYLTYYQYPEILILGGIHKSASFNKIKIKNHDLVLIYGQDKEKINSEISGILFNNLEEIFKYLKKIKDEYYVIFSPGCDSHDQFKNFEDRGNYYELLIDKYFIN